MKKINKYIIEDNSIICPLSIIKNVGSSIASEIIIKRDTPYKDFIDFIKRNFNSTVNNKKVIVSLITSGCFNNLGPNENTLLNNLDSILNYAELSNDAGMLEIEPPELIEYPNYSNEDQLNSQLESFGFYLSNHPTNIYRSPNDIETKNIDMYFDKNISITQMIDNIKEITTKKNDIMAFITAQDEFGSISLTFFPKTYKQYNNLTKRNIIRVFGHVERRFDKYQIVVNSLKLLK